MSEIKVRPIRDKRPPIVVQLEEMMKDTCPIWYFDKQQQLKRKKMKP